MGYNLIVGIHDAGRTVPADFQILDNGCHKVVVNAEINDSCNVAGSRLNRSCDTDTVGAGVTA